MIVFLNGKFVHEKEATVSVFDRSFLYGDGLFETLRVVRGRPFCWAEHMERLRRGAEFLNLPIPSPPDELLKHATELVRLNEMPEAILRLTLSRGVGRRGYSPRGANTPTLVMTLAPGPGANGEPRPLWRLITSSLRLPADEPLAEFKTCNKLPQILARAEADAAGADEALLLNMRAEIVEASSGNLFWIADGQVRTPALSSGILAGVTRQLVLGICHALNVPVHEIAAKQEDILRAQGVFLSLSSWGVVEAISLDGWELEHSPLSGKIQNAYDELIEEGRRGWGNDFNP